MANITKRNNSYRIRISCGRDESGKQKFLTKTWKPKQGMTPRQIEKELYKAVRDFESTAAIESNSLTASDISVADFCDQYMNLSQTSLTPYTQKA